MDMVIRKFRVITLGFLLGLAGCSSTPEKNIQAYSAIANLSNSQAVKRLLLDHYDDWRGTPYRYGGQSTKGVDCSAFVQLTFRNRLGHQLPRTTRNQIKTGAQVAKSELRVGDIVFFKVARNTLHNGVYLGDAKFMHASTSKGVTISDLNNVYWKKTYLTARRIN